MPIQFNSSLSSTGPFTAPSFTGSLFGTASHVKVTGSGVTVNWDGDLLQLTASAGSAQNASQVFVSESSPGLQPSGSLWWNSVDGNLYVQAEGPSGSSFVAATNTIVGAAGNAVSASYVPLIAGPGISIDGMKISASVVTVNGSFPDANGNIATGLVAVLTGPSSSLIQSASGDVTASITEGTVWIVSGDPTPSNNGLNWIYDVNPSGVGEWLVLSKQQFITSSVTSASVAETVNGTAGQLLSFDNRIITPSEIIPRYLQYGFTSWNNNNATPFADYLHMRSWNDPTAGNDNLVMFRKDAIGVRVYQQTFGSTSPYSTFKDLAFTDASNASGNWPTASYAVTASFLLGSVATASYLSVPYGIVYPAAQNTAGLSDTWADVVGGSITLPSAGTYEIQYNICTSGNSNWNAAGIFTSTNVYVPGSGVQIGVAGGGAPNVPMCGGVFVTITTATTYKLRVKSYNGATVNILQSEPGAAVSGGTNVRWKRIAQ